MYKVLYVAFAAITLDGRLARNSRDASDWTSPEDKQFFRGKVKEFNPDAVIVGRVTYDLSIEALAKYNCLVLTRSIRLPHHRAYYFDPEQSSLGKHVEQCGYQRIAVFGGTQTYSFCLTNNYLDELYLTLEPVVFGEGPALFEGQTHSRFTLLDHGQLNGTIFLHYTRGKQ